MNHFPNGDEEISLLKFIARYQYLNVNDAKYFFSSKRYYKKRLRNLISKRLLRKNKLDLVLGELGIEYAKLFKCEYNRLNRNVKYRARLLRLSNIGAFYNNCSTVEFTPSFSIKDKKIFTMTARRFIGILDINGIDYLTYQITDKHDSKYISCVIYDIQKEKTYKNFIIFVNNIARININDFAFGMNQVIIVENTEESKEKLKYYNSINWSKVIEKYYKNKVYLSEYKFCDYTNYKDKYVSTFYCIDTEKINRIKHFLRENNNRNIDIICCKEIQQQLKKEIPNANYIMVELEQYIDKERKVYD